MNTRLNPAAQNPARRDVLVVDDEASMRMALELSFGQRGWRVDTASGKSEALDCFRCTQHSLVVSDVRMTGGNGFELLQALRSIAPQTSVILLTAFAAVPDAVSAIKAGACEYLTKPVAFEQLLDLSEHLLSRNAYYGGAREGTNFAGSNFIPLSPGVPLQVVEKRLLEMTLAATAGNRSRAAVMLGISLRTVRNKIRQYNLPPRRDYDRIHDHDHDHVHDHAND